MLEAPDVNEVADEMAEDMAAVGAEFGVLENAHVEREGGWVDAGIEGRVESDRARSVQAAANVVFSLCWVVLDTSTDSGETYESWGASSRRLAGASGIVHAEQILSINKDTKASFLIVSGCGRELNLCASW